MFESGVPLLDAVTERQARLIARWMSLGFMLLIVATMMIADSPLLFRGHHRTQMVLDSAVRDLDELTAQLSTRLGAEVTAVSVLRIDEINDSTTVDVRYRSAAGARNLDLVDAR